MVPSRKSAVDGNDRGRNEDGASAVEYGLLVAAIAAIIVIIVFALGNVLQGSFKDTCDKIDAKAETPNGCATS